MASRHAPPDGRAGGGLLVVHSVVFGVAEVSFQPAPRFRAGSVVQQAFGSPRHADFLCGVVALSRFFRYDCGMSYSCVKKMVAACVAAGVLLSVALLVPSVCGFFIALFERVLREPLDYPKWLVRFPVYCIALTAFFALVAFYALLHYRAGKRESGRRLGVLDVAVMGVSAVCAQPSFAVFLGARSGGLFCREDLWLVSFAFGFLFLFALVAFAHERRAYVMSRMAVPAREAVRPLFSGQSARTFFAFAAFLFFCYFPVLLAQSGENPVDTERLFLTGRTNGFHVQSRFLAERLLWAFSASTVVYNTTPLMQLLGILELSAAGMVLCHVFADGRTSKLALLASLPAVLSPWFAHNMGYVHDASLHPLSMLFGIAPFLFAGSAPLFVAASLLCNYAMCMTYQLSSGVYVVATLYFALNRYLRARSTLRESLVFLGAAAASYLVALGFYEFGVFYAHPWNDYATGSLPPVRLIPALVARNARTYLTFVASDLGRTPLRALYALAAVSGMALSVAASRRRKAASVAAVLLTFPLALVLSFGVSLALEKPLWAPRAFIGIGVFMSLQFFMLVGAWARLFPAPKKPLAARLVPAGVALCGYCLVVFAYAHGAAMCQQKLYVDARIDAVVADLNSLGAPKDAEIRVEGGVGLAPAVMLTARTYPLIARAVPERASGRNAVFLLAQRGVGKPNYLYDFGGNGGGIFRS